MRFDRYGRHAFEDTTRRRAHVVRKHKREQEALPLFADQVARLQPSVDDVMSARRQRWDKTEARMRTDHALHWRRVRAKYYALTEEVRAVVAKRWTEWRGPAKPFYLGYVIDTALEETSCKQ